MKIEFAPKDGTKILVWDNSTQVWIAVQWCGWGGGVWQCCSTGHNLISRSDYFTDWMHMPPGPKDNIDCGSGNYCSHCGSALRS